MFKIVYTDFVDGQDFITERSLCEKIEFRNVADEILESVALEYTASSFRVVDNDYVLCRWKRITDYIHDDSWR